jgi:hypothetical protein
MSVGVKMVAEWRRDVRLQVIEWLGKWSPSLQPWQEQELLKGASSSSGRRTGIPPIDEA